jgi:hypothetical protein
MDVNVVKTEPCMNPVHAKYDIGIFYSQLYYNKLPIGLQFFNAAYCVLQPILP